MEEINTTNLDAYKDKGLFFYFKTKNEIQIYRHQCLENHTKVVDFIKKLIPNKKIKMIEIGSGFSALSYAMEKANILQRSFAIEQSKSSYEFANKWKIDYDIKSVVNINANALTIDYNKDNDLFVIIDSTFPLLFEEDEKYPDLILDKAYNSLKQDGIFLIEIVNFYNLVKNKIVNYWKEFPSTDNFKYGLYEEKYNKGMIERKSIYIDKKNNISEKKEIVKYYTIETLSNILKKHNFNIDKIYGGFDYSSFNKNKSDRIIIVARKNENSITNI